MYKATECSKRIIKEWWTDPKSRAFEAQMKMMQVELVECHWHKMDEETRYRAAQTTNYLITGEQPKWKA